jgi:hypothetical protein
MLPQLTGEAGEPARAQQDEWGGPVDGSGALRLSPTATVIEDIRAGRYWHNNVVKLVASWVGRGWSNAEIMLASDGLTLAGWTVEQTREEVGKAIGGARRKWGVEEPANGLLEPGVAAGGLLAPLAVHGLPWEVMEATGMRRWVYGHFLVRGFVSVLGAPGGFGKTAYAQAVALAIAMGRNLLDEAVHEPCKVAVWNLEDPYDEMLRRCWAAVLHHGISRSEVEDRLFLDSGRDRELVIAALDERGNLVATADVAQLVAEFKRHNIGVWIPDPLVRLHRLDENSNDHMDFFMTVCAQIAREANIAVLLPHHFRKGGGGGDADAFRGASAVINAARSAVSLTRMTAEEAGPFKVPGHERWRYLKVENAKLNTAPPPEHAVWLKLVSVGLPNGVGGEEGDNVQTVERWYPPSPFEALSMRGMVSCLDEIEAGEDGDYFTASKRGKSNERWVGNVLQRHCHEPLDDRRAQSIVNQWLQNGLLVEGSYKNREYKMVACVRVDPSKRSELAGQAGGPPKIEDWADN